MSTFFADHKFSSCEVGGVIAAGLLRDLRVNNFAFTNFPEVDVTWDSDKFYIKLKCHGVMGTQFELDYPTLKKELTKFRKLQDMGDKLFNSIQESAAELEKLIQKKT